MVPAFPGSNPGTPANSFFTIYKTTFISTGEFYVGKHKTSKLDDGYLGSGIKITNKIKKYGKDSFRKEILFIFDNEDDMNKKEAEIVTADLCSNPLCMNLAPGGKGGWSINASRFSNRKHSIESRLKTSRTMRGRTVSEEAKLKSSLTQTGVSVPSRGSNSKKSEHHKQNIAQALLGHERSLESIEKQLETRKQRQYIWISNCCESKSKMIKREELHLYPDWIKGRRF